LLVIGSPKLPQNTEAEYGRMAVRSRIRNGNVVRMLVMPGMIVIVRMRVIMHPVVMTVHNVAMLMGMAQCRYPQQAATEQQDADHEPDGDLLQHAASVTFSQRSEKHQGHRILQCS